MNIKVVEYSYPLIVISMIYLIYVCHDLRHTNDLQDVSLGEINKSLSHLMRTNIDSKKDDYPHQVTMKEDLVQKSVNMNSGSVSRKASHKHKHNSYDKHRYDHDVVNRVKSNEKKSMKEIWFKHQSLPNDSRKTKELVAGHNLMKLNQKQKQKHNFQERKKQLNKNVENTKRKDKMSTTIGRYENNLKSEKDSLKKKLSERIEKRRVESYLNEATLSRTSCLLTRAEGTPSCDDKYYYCRAWEVNGDCTNTTIMSDSGVTIKDWMIENCQRSCDACSSSVSLLDSQIQHKEYKNIISTFNLSLNIATDGYAYQTSWSFFSQQSEDSFFDSREVNITTKLENHAEYSFNYHCIIPRTEGNQLNDDNTSSCFNFEVHDSWGDGMCCEYGDGSFSVNINTNSSALKVEDNFENGSLISSSFCINHDDGKIESEGKFQHTHYPFKKWQCKNTACLCDSKPTLSSNTQENLAFLLEVTMLSDSNNLPDVESAQYKAACWVLHDDPFEYDLVEEVVQKRMIQRYILAVFYFATSPLKWRKHYDFLSSSSECDWNYIDDRYRGISCDEDDNVISIDIIVNFLEGTIVEELSGLRMLEYLDLKWNDNFRGTIPSVLGRLSELRYLNLNYNNLEGTIPSKLLDATNLEVLDLGWNRLEGTITESIGNLRKLSVLEFAGNDLSGSIPYTIYTLKNLEHLYLERNKISSSISTLVGNLNKLEWLRLDHNMLTGQMPSTIGSISSLKYLSLDNNRLSGSIPSTIGNMTSLNELSLHNNKLSGSIPESLFDLFHMNRLSLQDNSVTGSVPDEFCDRASTINADCRNDVFDPEVSCSCCTCKDESPIWNGDCTDTTIKVVVYHYSAWDPFDLEWSLTNDATGKKILHDDHHTGIQSYEACVAYSDCFSFNQISPPGDNTNYQIYWNNNSIYDGTFLGWFENDDINRDDPLQTILSFSYNEENQELASCYDIKLQCYEEEQPLLLEPNTTERIIYNQVINKLSSSSIIQNPSSPQSKALCWMLSNNHYDNKTVILGTEFIQRYILAILHFMSPYGLFGNHEYLAEKHECDWNGITCTENSTKIVTGISLSAEHNQIINGTLINEIGSLKYLKVLELNQTQLHGTIPRSFSNLWSLMKLDLSGNEINSTLPVTLFRQLNKLEYVDLSDNILSGSINQDIGSNTRIRVLSTRNNSFIGSLPLDNFKQYDLEHLDVSGNELSQIDFSLLLKHKNLKFLDISSNFFVGSLLDHTFTSLSKLRYFNVSQNDFSGTIPSTFPELSNITQLDLHANKLRGPIPSGITELRNMHHINLQGNALTGSLPSQLNQLKNLYTLVLSHNELKGSIPFDQNNLQKMERLHLQNNKLEGEAPIFSNIKSYITDCGFPSDSLEPVTCSTCNTCCNSDGVCQSKTSEKLSQVYKTLIFMYSIFGFTSMCYLMKDYITSISFLKSFFSETVFFWNAMMLISDKSVYHFLLAKNKTEWFVAVCCVMFQTATLFLFVHSADMSNEISDREYTMTCPSNSLECDNSNTVSSYGKFIFWIILIVWLLRDIINSVKLMLVSFQKRSIDFFFASAMVFTVTMLSIWTSVIYIIAIAGKNTDMIKDAVVLLFVVEIDERIFKLVESINPDWIDNNIRHSLVYGGDDLVITSCAKNSVKILKSIRKQIRERGEAFGIW